MKNKCDGCKQRKLARNQLPCSHCTANPNYRDHFESDSPVSAEEMTHRLMIPPDMLLIVPERTRKLHTKTVEIVDDNSLVTVVREPGGDVYHHVKRLWLEEIKDEPVSAEEALEKNHPKVPDWKQTEYNRGFEDGYLSGFLDGEENERLRHKPKQTLDECFMCRYPSIIGHEEYVFYKSGFMDSEKNMGYECD